MDLTVELSEAASPTDRFGFRTSVGATAEMVRGLLAGPNPVVVSVVGALGTGKSSFILQLIEELRFDHSVRVTFNAQLGSGGSMWSALADRIGAALYMDLHKRLQQAPAQAKVAVAGTVLHGRPAATAHWRDVAWWLIQGDDGLPKDAQAHFLSLFTDAAADLDGRGLGRGEARTLLAGVTVAGLIQTVASTVGQLPAGVVQSTLDGATRLANAQFARRPQIAYESEEFLTALNDLIEALLPGDARLVVVIEDVARLDPAGRVRFEHALGFIQGIRRAFVCIADDTARVGEHPAARLAPGTGEAFTARAIGLRIEVPVVRGNIAVRFLVDAMTPRVPPHLAPVVARQIVRCLSAYHVLTPRFIKRGLRYSVALMRLSTPAQAKRWPAQGAAGLLSDDDCLGVEAAVYLTMLLMLDDALEVPLAREDWSQVSERYPTLMDTLPWCIWDGSEWEGGGIPKPLRATRRMVRWWLLLRSVRPTDSDWLDVQEVKIAQSLGEEARAWMDHLRGEATEVEELCHRLRTFLDDPLQRKAMRQVVEFADRIGGSIPVATGLPQNAPPLAVFRNLILWRDLPDGEAAHRFRDILRSAGLALPAAVL